MMHRVWTRIVVAGLVILGEGAFASESNQRSDDRYEANGNAVQLSQPTVLDDAGSRGTPSLAGAYAIHPDINPAYQTFTAVTVPLSELLNYHPFNPRAPPLPANQ
jgi:hypothetical protein